MSRHPRRGAPHRRDQRLGKTCLESEERAKYFAKTVGLEVESVAVVVAKLWLKKALKKRRTVGAAQEKTESMKP